MGQQDAVQPDILLSCDRDQRVGLGPGVYPGGHAGLVAPDQGGVLRECGNGVAQVLEHGGVQIRDENADCARF